MKLFATSDRYQGSSASKKAFESPTNSDWCVCMPDPFSPNSGFGMNVACRPWRCATSLTTDR